MKELKTLKTLILFLMIPFMNNSAQEETASTFNIGADFYSNYIWRGSKLGTGPAFQPNVKFLTGGLTIGVWGSFDSQGYTEADPYISYSFPFGLSLGLTDYYSPSLLLFETSDTAGSHALEINVGYTAGGFSLSTNYIVNEAGAIASKGSDLYFQADYAFLRFNISIGAGDGWHTSDGQFNICHLALSTSKELKITDSFTIPVSGHIIINPEKEQLFVVVGFSL